MGGEAIGTTVKNPNRPLSIKMIIIQILTNLENENVRNEEENPKKEKITRMDLPMAGGPLRKVILLFSIKCMRLSRVGV